MYIILLIYPHNIVLTYISDPPIEFAYEDKNIDTPYVLISLLINYTIKF